MTFRNPILNRLVVGTFPDGTYIAIDTTTLGAPAIVLGTGDPGTDAPASIRSFYLGIPGDSQLTITGPTDSSLPSSPQAIVLTPGNILLSDGEGDFISAAQLQRPPGLVGSSSAAQSIPTTVVTTLTNYATVLASNGGCSIAAGVHTPSLPGRWRFAMQGRFAANVTGIRVGYAQTIAGVDEEAWTELPSGTQPSVMSAWWEDVYDGITDTFRWRVLQNSGGNLNWRTQRYLAEYRGPT